MQKPLKILRASAGSGKTFSLAVHYLILLFSGEAKYREILAVTFTNKATEEMKTRILEVLLGLAKGDSRNKISAYRDLILAAHPNLSQADLKDKADKIYRKILHDYSRFSVSTIDGFVQKVIRGFAFELGLNADYNLEMNYDKIKNDLVAKLDEALNDKPELLQWIIDLAIEKIQDNKSWNYKKELFDLSKEIFSECFQGFDDALKKLTPEEVEQLFKHYISNTKAEINQFETELIRLATDAQSLVEVSGLEASQLKGKSRSPLLKLVAIVNGVFDKLDALFNLIDEPLNWFQKGVNLPEAYAAINPVLKQMYKLYVDKWPGYQLAKAFKSNLYYLRLMQELAILLSQYREENDNLLISDAQKLISGITQDAGDNPSFIWEKVGNRYRNFLFDEFQDTSLSQWQSFKSLLSNALASPSTHFTDHLIVGDTKQAIYRWRNGDWRLLHQQAKQDVGPHHVIEESLEENYRSTANIIAFNNFLYQATPIIIQQALNQAVPHGDEALSQWWQDKNYHQIVTQVYAGVAQKTAANTPKGGTIKVKRFSKLDSDDGAALSEIDFKTLALANVIEEIKILSKNQNYAYRDMAILVRSGNEATFAVEQLMAQGLPVLSGDALLISSNAAVQLLINTLKVLIGLDAQNTLYKANCIALYHTIHQKIVDPTHYLQLNKTNLSALSYVLPSSLCENWQTWLQLPLVELVENLIAAYQLQHLSPHLPYLLAFRDLLSNAVKMGERGIIAFLTWWEEDGQMKKLPSPEGADAIQILTIHKSKGLAFRAVFVPFCNWELKGKNDIFWVSAAETPYEALNEIPLKYSSSLGTSTVAKAYFEELLYNNMDALNMLYVATTRSIDYLYLATLGKVSTDLTKIGDVIGLALADQLNDMGYYELSEVLDTQRIETNENLITLNLYPTTNRLSALYVPSADKHLNYVLNTEKSGREGNILHDILAKNRNQTEIEKYVNNLVLEGNLTVAEAEGFKQSALAVLQHPDLQLLLNESANQVVEKTIVDAKGKAHRPDLLLINQQEVVVVDYKFTAEESPSHSAQMARYKTLLGEMGYQNIKTYLFYAEKGQLKQV